VGFPWAGRFEMNDCSVPQQLSTRGLELLAELREARGDLVTALAEEEQLSALGEAETAHVEQIRGAAADAGHALSASEIWELRSSTVERKQIEHIQRSKKRAQSRLAQVCTEMQKTLAGFRYPENAELFKLLDRLSPELGVDSADSAITVVAQILELKGGPGTTSADQGKSEWLVDSEDAVTYQTAAKALDVTVDHVRRLVRARELDSLGGGHYKKITADSLRRYIGLSVGKKSRPVQT
jgi:hypothetical protein